MTHDASPLRTVARPKQARSQETLYRILDAAEALIEEKGLADASIPEIARRAGSSVGGIYARLRDKNELLRALEERFFNELSVRLEDLTSPERWNDAPIAEIARTGVAELVTVFRERRALIQAFIFRAVQDPEFREDGLRFRRKVSDRFIALLRPRFAEVAHPDPEVAVDLGVQFAIGLVQQIALFGELPVRTRPLSDAELIEELTRNFLAYVGAATDGERRTGDDGSRRGPKRGSHRSQWPRRQRRAP